MVSPTVPPLYNYQDRVVAWTAERDCGFWAIDMGLGKTRCAIEHIRRTGRPGIVFAPLQVAMSTWPKEVRKWADGMHYAVLHGPSKRDRLLTGADLLIINYDGLPWLAANHAGLLKGRTAFFDESTSVKSPKTTRTKLSAILRPQFKECYMLSATPTPNGIQDIWAQAHIMDEGARLGRSYTSFLNKYFNVGPFYKVSLRYPEAQEEILAKLSDCMIRLKGEDYQNLPPYVVNDIEVELPAKLKDRYKQFHKDFIYDLGNEKVVTAVNAAVLGSKLRQFIQGGLYDENRAVAEIHTLKLDMLEQIQEELAGEPNLVVINFKFELDAIRKRFGASVPAITGETPVHTRVAIENEWNRGALPMIVVHPATVSRGLNLQDGGHYITWMALTWNWEHYHQLNGRLRRSGQTKPVVLNRLIIPGTIDARVAAALEAKGAGQEAVLQALASKESY